MNGLSEYAIRAIYNDAVRAASWGQTVQSACPYAYDTAEGKWWRVVYAKAVAASVK